MLNSKTTCYAGGFAVYLLIFSTSSPGVTAPEATGLDTHGMDSVGQLADFPTNGGVEVACLRVDAAAVARHTGGKHLISVCGSNIENLLVQAVFVLCVLPARMAIKIAGEGTPLRYLSHGQFFFCMEPSVLGKLGGEGSAYGAI